MSGCRPEVGAEALGEADAAQVEARVEGDAVGAAEDELGGAAANVDDYRSRRDVASRGDSAEGEERLLLATEEPRLEGVAPLDLAEERLAVLGVADGTRRKRERPLRAGLLRRAPVLDQDVADARDGLREQDAPLVHALT